MPEYVSIQIIIVNPRNGREIDKHPRVPYNWTGKVIRERFGIAEHLSIYREEDGQRILISAGR